ncbi:MAG: TolC family protein [Saprospirales bacterium]|nr:MAG: TolC family protein [Saprospirales bacterium]
MPRVPLQYQLIGKHESLRIMRGIYIFISIFFFIAFSTFAQEPEKLSLEQLIEEALENNFQILIGEQRIKQAEGLYRQTDALFLPQISLSHTGMITNNPLMAFGSKLNQGKLTAADFDPNLLNNPDRVDNFNTKIELTQPIYNRDGQLRRASAKMGIEMHDLELAESRALITFQMEELYMRLQLSYEQINAIQKTIEWIDATELQAINYLREGLIHRADLLEISFRKNEVENQLQRTLKEIENLSDMMSYYMGKEINTVWAPVEGLKPGNNAIEFPDIPSENREDIQMMKVAAEINKVQRNAVSASIFPQLNAFGSFELNDSKAFHGRSNGYILGLQLTWKVFEGGMRRGRIQEAEASHRKSLIALEEYQSRTHSDLNRAKRIYELAIEQEQLAVNGLITAKEVLRLRTDRFEQGLEKITDLLLAESRYTDRQLEYHRAIYQKNTSLAKLRFLSRGSE